MGAKFVVFASLLQPYMTLVGRKSCEIQLTFTLLPKSHRVMVNFLTRYELQLASTSE